MKNKDVQGTVLVNHPLRHYCNQVSMLRGKECHAYLIRYMKLRCSFVSIQIQSSRSTHVCVHVIPKVAKWRKVTVQR